MVIQVIESRYTVEYDVLVEFLDSIFGSSSFEIVVRRCLPGQKQRELLIDHLQVPDEGEKWKVSVPRELTRVGYPSIQLLAIIPLT